MTLCPCVFVLYVCVESGTRRISLAAPQSRSYEFDKVYTPEASQEEVYASVTPLLRSVVEGFNAALLAYGQTGTGKTYTLGFEGESNEGILPRACQDLFCMQKEKTEAHRRRGETLHVQVRLAFLTRVLLIVDVIPCLWICSYYEYTL